MTIYNTECTERLQSRALI